MSDLLPWLAPWSGRAVTALWFIAFIALAFFLVRRRDISHPTCPRCRYDLSATSANAPCPECGRTSVDADRLRARRHVLFSLLALATAFLLPGYVVSRRIREFGPGYYLRLQPFYTLWPRQTLDHLHIDGFDIRVSVDRRAEFGFPQRLTITHNGREFYSVEDARVFLGPAFGNPAPSLSSPQDLNADGSPDLFIERFSGGAHCCFSYTIVSLDPDNPRVLLDIDTGDGGLRVAEPPRSHDAQGRALLVRGDTTFAYWNTSFAASPIPLAVLAWDGQTWSFSPEHNLAPPPSEDELAAQAAEFRAAFSADAPDSDPLASPSMWGHSELWGRMLDLIYTGHADRAMRFLNEAWPDDRPGREEFRRDFLETLARSPIYDGLVRLNSGVLPPRPPAP